MDEVKNATGRTNPFLVPYNTPHDTVPFERITLEDYEEAFLEGIRRDEEAIEDLVNDPAEPTFENTIIRTDESKGPHYYDLLDRVSNVFSCMLGAETNDELDALAQKMSPLLSKHANDVAFNEKLFQRIKHVYHHHRELTAEEQMLLDNAYNGFVRSGALLDKEGKDTLRKLTEEASILCLQFSQNLRKETKAYTLHITNIDQLKGLPETALEAAAEAASERNLDGWVFTLDMPSYLPFITYAENRELRKELFTVNSQLCTHDNDTCNLAICQRLVNLRREMAQLLGFETYADYVLVQRMASSTARVYQLLNDLIDAYKPVALKEHAEVEQLAKRLEGDDFVMQAWDVSFYTHKLKMEKHNLDPEMLRPYFPLHKVIEGVFGLATRLYGITFKENNDIPVYHPDVKAYEVFDRDGSYLAVLYADFHPRKGKRNGAWMTEFQGQWIDRKGNNIRPHVSLVMNLTKPTPQKPSLLTLGEVETFLHEFGHALHGIFANTRFQSLSGTNVWWDFVELPSQFMENYATNKEFLHTFAFHYQTGEPIPDELIDRVRKSSTFMAGKTGLRQVSLGLLDMAYYTLSTPFEEPILPFEKKAWEKALIAPLPEKSCMTTQFSHIMSGGYAAGYYSYKWAEVLDADAFSMFKEEGVFNSTTAQRFRDEILSKGGTEHPMTLYKRFRGKEPTIEALLERSGITPKK